MKQAIVRVGEGLRAVRPLEWLYLAGGLALVHRYLWVLDDAFVYFRYVDNLLFLDRGLVFNQGEYVEGYSSPFWVLLLIALRSTGLDYYFLTQALAYATFAGFAFLVVALNRRLSPDGPVVNFPLAYLGFSYGVLCYFSSGIETPLVQIAAVLFALFILNPSSRVLQVLLGVSPLVRHELALPYLLCLAWAVHRERRIPWAMIASAAVVVGGWVLFRVWYYADLFPNTFYLKNETWISQGLVYVVQTVMTYSLPLVLLAFGALTGWIHHRDPDARGLEWKSRAVMILCALSVTAYVVKIGGDPRHYRFLAFPYVLTVCALAGLVEHGLARASQRRRWLAPALGLTAAALGLSSVPPQLERHPILRSGEHQRVGKITDATWHRENAGTRFHPDRGRQDRTQRASYRPGPDSGRYRTCTLCFPAYGSMNDRFVHRLGLTDPVLARTDAESDRPAHKYSLHPRAKELAVLLTEADPVGPEAFRRAVEAGTAPEWIREGLESIEVVAGKTYNRHDWAENLTLAFTFPPRIHVPRWQDEPEAAEGADEGP